MDFANVVLQIYLPPSSLNRSSKLYVLSPLELACHIPKYKKPSQIEQYDFSGQEKVNPSETFYVSFQEYLKNVAPNSLPQETPLKGN